jgi:hypothetical protein
VKARLAEQALRDPPGGFPAPQCWCPARAGHRSGSAPARPNGAGHSGWPWPAHCRG